MSNLTTQRAYTMKIMLRDEKGKSVVSNESLKSLWNTHKKINDAVKVVGN